MKQFIVFLASISFIILLQSNTKLIQSTSLDGAWMHIEGNTEQVLLIVDGYYTQTNYSKAQKQFLDTRGGVFSGDKKAFNVLVEFDTKNKEQIGKIISNNYAINKNELTIEENGNKSVYKKIDDAKATLAGVWAITGRMQEGKIVQIQRIGTRKTLKILTGTRFQWAAIDPGQQSFSGTGGGSYDFKEGKYTEHIEFFSRDSSRVGASLTFDGKIENGDWHHSGLSSKGDKIYEVWSKIK
jgi:hypothetical protein